MFDIKWPTIRLKSFIVPVLGSTKSLITVTQKLQTYWRLNNITFTVVERSLLSNLQLWKATFVITVFLSDILRYIMINSAVKDSGNSITVNLCQCDMFVHKTHRHLRKIDWLMAHTACLVYLVSTVSGCYKKPLEEAVLVAGT